MSTQHPTQGTGDKTKQALAELSSLMEQHPEKSRHSLLQQVEKQFDLTPKECGFLNSNFHK